MHDDAAEDGTAHRAAAGSSARPAADHRAVFERSPVGMAVLDGAGRVLEANPALGVLLGRDVPDLLGATLHEVATSDDEGRFGFGASERRLRHGQGHDVWAVVSAVGLPEAGPGGLLVCLDDATGRRNTERMLLHAALHDSLTNLPNRRLLRDRLDTALARSRRTASTVAVLFVDLDRFKTVNDTHGHEVGDEVLVAVAGAIHAALRSSDTVARLGGDEFVVVCEDVTDVGAIETLAERILAHVGRPVSVRGRSVSVAASIGIAVAGPRAETGDELIRLADGAMFQAKRRHGVAYVVADREGDVPRAEDAAGEAEVLLADLRHAIQHDQLELHYQPVVRVDGQVIGLEALVRWPHPRLGLLLPHQFLPRVAGSSLGRSLSDWVLRSAVRDAASWRDPGLRVGVNMWAAEVSRPGFAETVAMLLTWAGLQGRGLYLELHEQDLAHGGADLAEELDQLRQLGVGLAVDGVGRGSSPDGLRRLPVDTVKVGRAVVAGCLHDPGDLAVATAAAVAARAAGQHSLATGVETPAQLRMLRDLGYEGVQGYLTGAPAPLIDLREVVTSRRVTLEGQ